MKIQENHECFEKSSHLTLYNPALLLDALLRKLELSTDKELARVIGVTPSMISKIRTHSAPVSPGILIRINELTNVAIADIKAIIGERRTRQFYSDDVFNRGRRAGD